VQIYTPDQKYIYKARISNIEEELQEEQFLRVHKSYLVPINKVESVSPTEIGISNKEIPIGRTYRQVVMKRLGIKD
jgi:DNA-binding LytR/AlgR family response regulator